MPITGTTFNRQTWIAAFRPILVLLLLILLWTSCFGLNRKELSSQLDSLAVNNPLAKARLAIAVYNPVDTSLVYGFDVDGQMIPASLNKLVTAIAALNTLGSHHCFQTRIGYRGEIRNGVLEGDLVVKGGGDPSWIQEIYPDGPHRVFELWADSLLAMGITAINGDLVADISHRPTLVYNPLWDAEDSPYGYSPSLCALSFNANMVRYDLRADSLPGLPVSAKNRFGYAWHTMRNEIKTGTSNNGVDIWLEMSPDTRSIVLKGTLGKNIDEFLNAAVRDPAGFALQNIAQVFRRKGISISGNCEVVDTLRLDNAFQTLLIFQSVTLKPLLEVMLKTSSNYVTESVLYALGSNYGRAINRVSGYLESLGIGGKTFRIVDGCGLSRQNMNTAGNLGMLLCHAYNQDWFDTFLSTLATPGENGTLQKRFPQQQAAPRIYAKTGTMSGVSNLSGYFLATNGRLYAFVILCNDVGSVAAAQKWQDVILNKFTQFSGN